MPVRTDRGEIIHEAGRRRLSPALRDGAPTLVAAGEAGARCGWAEFFAALERRGLGVAFGEGGEVSVAARGGASPPRPSPAARVRAAFAEARRFVAALRPGPRPS
jgi:hypothetical protein